MIRAELSKRDLKKKKRQEIKKKKDQWNRKLVLQIDKQK